MRWQRFPCPASSLPARGRRSRRTDLSAQLFPAIHRKRVLVLRPASWALPGKNTLNPKNLHAVVHKESISFVAIRKKREKPFQAFFPILSVFSATIVYSGGRTWAPAAEAAASPFTTCRLESKLSVTSRGYVEVITTLVLPTDTGPHSQSWLSSQYMAR
jgi:hypothetical protein